MTKLVYYPEMDLLGLLLNETPNDSIVRVSYENCSISYTLSRDREFEDVFVIIGEL